jgi:hypothetical protein
MIKQIFAFVVSVFVCINAVDAATRVRGHYNRKSGTYTQSHYRSKSDKSKINNYSSRGNRNPYTGKKGTKKTW